MTLAVLSDMPLDTMRAFAVSFLRLASCEARLMSLTLTVADLPASILKVLLPRTLRSRRCAPRVVRWRKGCGPRRFPTVAE